MKKHEHSQNFRSKFFFVFLYYDKIVAIILNACNFAT